MISITTKTMTAQRTRKDDVVFMNDTFDSLFQTTEQKPSNVVPMGAETKKEDLVQKESIQAGLPEPDEESLTPLERMKRDQENRSMGMVIEKQEEKRQYKSPAEESMFENASTSMDEMDKMIQKAAFARSHGLLKEGIDQTSDSLEDVTKRIEMIEDLNKIKISEDGKKLVAVDENDDKKDSGDSILEANGFRTEGDRKTGNHFVLNAENEIQVGIKPEGKEGADDKKEENPDNNATNSTASDGAEPSSEEREKEKAHRAESVTVIINKLNEKTVSFTEDERSKMIKSKVINVKVVDDLDMKSIEIDRSPISFSDLISEFRCDEIQTPVVFPQSGFRAYMTGMSVSEMMAFGLNNENGYTIDDIRKRLTIVYRHMVNPSIQIQDFNEFLRVFAWSDVEIAVWGALISSLPPEDTITLKCGNKKCGKSYEINYAPSSILDWNEVSTEFIDKFKEIVSTTAVDTTEIAKRSDIRKSAIVELPYTKIRVELGRPSAADYLNRIAPATVNEDAVKAITGENPTERDMNVFLATMFVRVLYFPKNGKYHPMTSYESIYHALSILRPGELTAILNIVAKRFPDMEPTFTLPASKCPYCENMSEKIEVTASELLFQRAQDLSRTEFEVTGI